MKRGDFVYNSTAKKRMKISRMIKMHANEMEEINEALAGDIFAIFGVECKFKLFYLIIYLNKQVLLEIH
jgi:elongation factor G